jgi:metallo-beta-lactamase family protein
MKLRFLGAARTVTGSSHVIEVGGTRVMLDCGLFQGRREDARRQNEMTCRGHVCEKLDAVVLSHGHLDHCGRLPMLHTEGGFRGPIYCTAPTNEIARVVLQDSAEIQVEDADYINHRNRVPGQPEVKPLYTPRDVDQITRQFRGVRLGDRFVVGDIGFTLLEAGHILGSSYVWIDYKEGGATKHVLFTADIGRFDTPIINDPVLPTKVADVVITESTYGARKHDSINTIEPQFEALLKATIERRSRLIIPSFAVGRTQTMLWYIAKMIVEGRIPPIRIYIDSPMGVDMTRVYTSHAEYYDGETSKLVKEKDLFGLKGVTLASSGEQSKAINADRGPCVIIASSPTCEFGRVLHHLKNSLERAEDALLFVGWTPPGTLGRRLQDGEKRVRVFDRFYSVKCQVNVLHGMSAHADGDEMMRFLTPAVDERTKAFVVHGEPDQSEHFAQRLIAERGVKSALVPGFESSYFD